MKDNIIEALNDEMKIFNATKFGSRTAITNATFKLEGMIDFAFIIGAISHEQHSKRVDALYSMEFDKIFEIAE